MTKQTELKHLLQELEIATRTHERCGTLGYGSSPDQKARAFQAADVAEKRVFSFFDALRRELEDSARAYKNLQGQRNHVVQERDEARKAAVDWQNAAQKAKADLQELAKQVMAMKEQQPAAPVENATPAPGQFVNVTVTIRPNEPFNEMCARAGDPIQFRPVYSNKYEDARFVGMHSNGGVVVEVGASMFAVELDRMRMKPKAPQQLQMFATVFKDVASGHTFGNLHMQPQSPTPVAPPGVARLVTNAPVTITVAK